MIMHSPDDTQRSLPLAVVGVDFRRAPARKRDKLLLSDAERVELTTELRQSLVADGLACLDTCNRTEWIVSADEPVWAAEILRCQMLARERSVTNGGNNVRLVPYVHVGVDAARHIFEVAAGLESFVVGEKEIASQLHRALERSRDERSGSPILNGMGMAVGRLTRDTHRVDLTGSGPRGVHDVAVRFLCARFPERPRVAVVGLGQIGQKVVRALRRAGLDPELCNRTVSLGWTQDHAVTPMDELAALLGQVDAAVVCTAAPRPVVTAELLSGRAGDAPLLLLDLGIPAQVEPSLEVAGVELADLEVIQAESERAVVASWADLAYVRRRVGQAIGEFEKFCRERRYSRLLRATQERHQRYMQQDVPRVIAEAGNGLPATVRSRLEAEMKGLIRSYTNAVFRDIRAVIGADAE